jgi:hypothetical protein
LKKILVSINGNQDPFSRVSSDGPILSLLYEISDFDEVVLFFTPNQEVSAEETAEAIGHRHPSIRTQFFELTGLEDPTNYEQILAVLRSGLEACCPTGAQTR